MAKARTSFICQQCGASSPAYFGRCPGCGAWNSMVETIEERPQPGRPRRDATPSSAAASALGATGDRAHSVPIAELDRVLGGGLVPDRWC